MNLNEQIHKLNQDLLNNQEILDKGTCPECSGSNLFPEDHPVKCFDCDASDYE